MEEFPLAVGSNIWVYRFCPNLSTQNDSFSAQVSVWSDGQDEEQAVNQRWVCIIIYISVAGDYAPMLWTASKKPFEVSRGCNGNQWLHSSASIRTCTIWRILGKIGVLSAYIVVSACGLAEPGKLHCSFTSMKSHNKVFLSLSMLRMGVFQRQSLLHFFRSEKLARK